MGLEDFKALARNLFKIPNGTQVTVVPLGLDDFQIRAGFTYWMAESRQMEMLISDTKTKRLRLKLAGNTDYPEVVDLFRRTFSVEEWNDIKIVRKDGAPFWIENQGKYNVEIMYNPTKDPRPICTIRMNLAKEHQVFLIPNYRAETEDPVAILADVCSRYGFVNPGNHLQVEGNPRAGQVTFAYKIPTTVTNIKIQPHDSRTFKILADDGEPWDTGEILTPAGTPKE
jgi:hypothetical protein